MKTPNIYNIEISIRQLEVYTKKKCVVGKLMSEFRKNENNTMSPFIRNIKVILFTMSWNTIVGNYRANYSEQKQHKNQKNNNNYKTKMRRKAIICIFKATNEWNIKWEKLFMVKNWTTYERETESLLITGQTTLKPKWILNNKRANVRYAVIDVTINHKLPQKESPTRHDSIGKAICRELKFDHTNKWFEG